MLPHVSRLVLALAGVVVALMTGRSMADVGPVPAGDYLIHNFTVDDGLRSDTLYDLTQDKDGYLWCASAVGLVRFDGVRFTVFDKDNTPGLATRAVYSVKTGPGGHMWVTDERFALGLWRDGRLQALPLRTASDRPPEPVLQVRPDSRGGLWIQSRGDHAYRWREGMGDPEPVGEAGPVPMPWPGNGPEWHEAKGALPETLRYGLTEDGRFVAKADPDGVDAFRAARCFPRVAGGLWMLEDTGQEIRLRALSPAGTISAARRLPRFSGAAPVAYLEDREGGLWIALEGSRIQRISPDGTSRLFSRRDGLPSDNLRALLLDREGNVWAATGGGGLTRFTRRRFQMLGRAEGLQSEIIYSVIPATAGSGGGLWVASHGGGVQRFQDGRFVRVPGFDAFPWALHIADDGALWVGDLMNGLGTLRSGTAAQVVPGRQFDAICDDPSGGGWAGGHLLCRWHGDSATILTNWPGGIAINALACTPDGALHIGTSAKGLWILRGGRFEPSPLPGCPADVDVSALLVDPEGVLWIGTTGHGLFRSRDGRSKGLSVKDGLADRSVLGIAEDAIGNFWFTSLAGIFRVGRLDLEDFFDGRATRVTSHRFDTEDGLATLQCTDSSQPKIARTPDGRMWFATMRGLASTDPATMPVNTAPPPVVIEQFSADGQLLQRPKDPAAQINVAPGTRRIEVQFTALSLTAPARFGSAIASRAATTVGPRLPRNAASSSMSRRPARTGSR